LAQASSTILELLHPVTAFDDLDKDPAKSKVEYVQVEPGVSEVALEHSSWAFTTFDIATNNIIAKILKTDFMGD